MEREQSLLRHRERLGTKKMNDVEKICTRIRAQFLKKEKKTVNSDAETSDGFEDFELQHSGGWSRRKREKHLTIISVLWPCGILEVTWKAGGKSRTTKCLCFTAFCKPVALQAPQGPRQPDSTSLTQNCSRFHTSKTTSREKKKNLQISASNTRVYSNSTWTDFRFILSSSKAEHSHSVNQILFM